MGNRVFAAGKIMSWLLLVALLLAPAVQAAETIRINGSGSGLDMMKPIIKAYQKMNPGVKIVMDKPLGSSGATKALLAGMLDIAVGSKPLKPEETANGARIREYAKTPVLFVTHKGVRKSDVTVRELVAIYDGRKGAWDDRTKLRLILRPEGDIDTRILRGLSPEFSAALNVAQKREGMTIAVTDPESNDMVAKTPGALGATGLTSLIVDKPLLNPLTLNGVRGTPQSLANGTYPLAKNIHFVLVGKVSPGVEKFLDFVYSARGRALAEKTGVLIIAPENRGR